MGNYIYIYNRLIFLYDNIAFNIIIFEGYIVSGPSYHNKSNILDSLSFVLFRTKRMMMLRNYMTWIVITFFKPNVYYISI